VAGLAAAFGSGAMTNPIADIEKADVILITGSNTSENHPVLSSFVKRAVKFRGAKLIVVDPRRIKMTEFAQHWLRPNLGTDVAWINGMMHVILKEKMQAAEFIQNRTEGFEALQQSAWKNIPPNSWKASPAFPRRASSRPGSLPAPRPAASSTAWASPSTSAAPTTSNPWPTWPCSPATWASRGGRQPALRGQNNVQGACDMGGLPNVYTGYQPVSDLAVAKKMEEAWGVTGLPTQPGLTVTKMLPQGP
jgi:formate dehydrogenase major subunit